MNDVSTYQGPGPVTHGDNPFGRGSMPDHVNAGAVAIESERAIAEAQGKLVIAKRFPRDESRAYDRVMASCSRPSLAAVAEYAFPRGGQTVRGPSIRLAEELARNWGNVDYGIRELSRKDGVSEMEAYAWDLETNTMSAQKFTVRHIRDKRGGGQALTDERDIYELTANQGGRRLRARLLAILPPDLVEAAVDRCRQTLAGNSQEPISDRVRKMIGRFNQYGITERQLSQYLGKSLDDVIADDLADLASVFNSIKSGTASASDFFGGSQEEAPSAVSQRSFQGAAQEQASTASQPANDNNPGRAKASQSKAKSKAKVKPEPEQQATPDPQPEPQQEPEQNNEGDPIGGDTGGEQPEEQSEQASPQSGQQQGDGDLF